MEKLSVHERIIVEPLLLSPTAAFMLASPNLRGLIGGVSITPLNFTRTVASLLGENEGIALEMTTGLRLLSHSGRFIFWNQRWYGYPQDMDDFACVLFFNTQPRYVSVEISSSFKALQVAAECIHANDSQMIVNYPHGYALLLGSQMKDLGADGFICTRRYLDHLKHVGTYDQFADFLKFMRVVTKDEQSGVEKDTPTPAEAIAAGADIVLVGGRLPIQENHKLPDLVRIATEMHEEVRQAFIDNGREDELA